MTTPTVLPELLAWRAERPATVVLDAQQGQSVATDALARTVERKARVLVAAGVRPGDRVALLVPNSLACVEALLAVATAGAAAVPVNLRWTAPEVDRLLADARPRLLVADAGALARLGALAAPPPILDAPLHGGTAHGALPAPAPDDTALILYTSGTTGRAKGAMLTHRNLLSNAARIASWLGLGPGDRFLTVMPLFHANAIVLGLMTPLLAGASTVIADRFRADTYWELAARYRPTTGGTVPTMLALLRDRPDAPPSAGRERLRFLLTGSAPVPADLLLAAEARLGVPVIEGYGLTECTCRATFNPIDGRRRLGSCGLPLEPLRIVDPADQDVTPGAVGEIVLRGPHVMRGYFDLPEATAHALRGGWLHSGDLARRDAEGFVHVVGRACELVIRGGENVYPREIDDVLAAHPDVAEAGAVGVPDARYGEVIWAYVAPRPGATLDPSAIDRWCRDRLADYKCPARVVVLAELPKGPTGKILKARLPTNGA
ncbi:MAG: AMP-binding protein [Candidatus Binatia bacterium]